MEKSDNAFRTISEVADWLDTQPHVLRFWESKFNQIKPVRRAGGRRYYRPSDARLLGGIKYLLHEEGMTVKGTQKILRAKGIKYVSGLCKPLEKETEGVLDEGLPEAPPLSDVKAALEQQHRDVPEPSEGRGVDNTSPQQPNPDVPARHASDTATDTDARATEDQKTPCILELIVRHPRRESQDDYRGAPTHDMAPILERLSALAQSMREAAKTPNPSRVFG